MYFSIRSITQPTICSKNLPLGDRTGPLRPQLPTTLKASSQELSTPLANTHMSSMYTYIFPKANWALETVPAIPPRQNQFTGLHLLVFHSWTFTLMHDNSYKLSMYLAAKQKKYKKPSLCIKKKHKKTQCSHHDITPAAGSCWSQLNMDSVLRL